VEFTIVDLATRSAKAFEVAVSADRSRLLGETFWYRMIAGANEQAFPVSVNVRGGAVYHENRIQVGRAAIEAFEC
jgi:hypothetical protein